MPQHRLHMSQIVSQVQFIWHNTHIQKIIVGRYNLSFPDILPNSPLTEKIPSEYGGIFLSTSCDDYRYKSTAIHVTVWVIPGTD